MRKFRALLILTNAGEPEYISHLDNLISKADKLDIRKAKNRIGDFEDSVGELMEEVGAKASLEEMEEIVSPDDGHPAGTELFMPKTDLEILFDSYENHFPRFANLPPHARIGISRGGREKGILPPVYLLDASLFEDLVIHMNTSVDLVEVENKKDSSSKSLIKRGKAERRSTIKAAYNFLEGYLNCIAYDILFEEEGLTKEEKSMLDHESYLSLRRKVLQYPKIALGRRHPPVQESHCEALSHILSREKGVRHALIHPRPHSYTLSKEEDLEDYGVDHISHRLVSVADSHRGPVSLRENAYWSVELDEVGRICDSAVQLVRRIQSEMDNRYGEIDWWLYEREKSGRFPEEALE